MEDSSRQAAALEAKGIPGITAKTKVSMFIQGDARICLKAAAEYVE